MQKHFLPTILIATALGLLVTSCQTNIDLTSNKTGWSDYAKFATKDFTPLGIVRLVSTETTIHSGFNLNAEHKGSTITYDMLIAEAKKLGADDIINVRIDVQRTVAHSLLDFFTGYTDTKTFTGNALAIKYKDGVAGANHSTQGGDDSGIVKDKTLEK